MEFDRRLSAVEGPYTAETHSPAPPQVPRDQDLGSVLRKEFVSSITNALCVTLYNETRAEFEATIRSLLVSMRHCERQSAPSRSLCALCILIDGRLELDPGIARLLGSCGLLNAEAILLGNDIDLYITEHTSEALLRGLNGEELLPASLSGERLHVLVCLKHRNRGKLQSHLVFFDTLCRLLQPKYCFQVDSGTTVAPDSIAKVVEEMESGPDIAALALRVMPPVPGLRDGFLSGWQYLDFALQKLILWPFEVAMGHLSVIPGQACALRWGALQSRNADPLKGYLRGVDAATPFDKVMFLAEDRVIGNEIKLAQGHQWRLEYAAEVSAVTDSCRSFGELFRQRRRWRNSSIACRLWLLRQWPAYLSRSDRDSASKRQFSVAMSAQLMLIARELLVPAQLAAVLAVVVAALSATGHVLRTLLLGAVAADCLLSVLVLMVPWMQASPGSASIRALLRGITAALLIGSLVASVPLGAASLLLLAPAITLIARSSLLPKARLIALASMHFFLVSELLMLTLLSFYSFWNLHDVSWGTKGLTRTEGDRRLLRQMKSWRNRIVAGWFLANSLGVAVAIGCKGLLFPQLNPVIEVSSILDIVIVGAALWHLTQRSRWLLARASRRAKSDTVNAL